jgi:pseudouridine kinase
MVPTVAVIGTIFMDCKGFARHGYNPAGRNLGNIKFVHGGVGRNVAENIANMGICTNFMTSIDRSGIGKEVLARLVKGKVNTDYIVEADARGMGIWLAIMDDNGDLVGSVSQMPDLINLENYITEKGAECIRRSSHVVLELDLNERITRKVIGLAEDNCKPVYGIPGNLDVILNNMDILSGIDCFICNNIEAEKLLGVRLPVNDPEYLQQQLTLFARKVQIPIMVITLGSAGSVYYDLNSDKSGYQPIFPVTVIDTTGAGDAFFSGTIAGLVRGRRIQEAVFYGTKIASWTVQSNENTCRDLTAKLAEDPLFASLELKVVMK